MKPKNRIETFAGKQRERTRASPASAVAAATPLFFARFVIGWRNVTGFLALLHSVDIQSQVAKVHFALTSPRKEKLVVLP